MANEKADSLRPIQDSRGFFMLPQSPMESGYYTYGKLHGKPDEGAYQYPHPIMMTAILRVGLEWQAIDRRRFGVGNISLAGGTKPDDHAGHRDGLEVPATWMDSEYDQAATAKLIELFRTFAPVKLVRFNDTRIPFVKWTEHHDDHFHVELMG